MKDGFWNYIKQLKYNNIFIKSFLIITILVVIPMLCMNYVIYFYSDKMAKEQISKITIDELTRIKSTVDMVIEDMSQLTLTISLNSSVQLFILSSLNQDTVLYNTKRIKQYLYDYIKMNSNIHSLYIYSEKNKYVLSPTRSSNFIDDFTDESWFDTYQKRKSDNNLGYYYINPRTVRSVSRKNYVYKLLTVVRPVYLSNYKSEGAVVVNLDLSQFRKTFHDNKEQSEKKFYIVDLNGTILYDDSLKLINKNINRLGFYDELDFSKNKGSLIKSVGDERQIISFIKSSKNDLLFISRAPISYYNQKTNDLLEYIRVFLLGILLSVIIVSLLISYLIFRPVINLISIIDEPNCQDDGSIKKSIPGFFKYFRSIFKIIDTNKNMQEEISRRLTLLKKSQLNALQAQINPHFLFNTLDTIKWKAFGLTNRENNITEMLSSLAQLVRLAYKFEDNLIPLEKEIEHVSHYIAIQKNRYNDKFKVIWEVNKKLYNKKVLKIILQPLVENSLYYGIKKKAGKGLIKIKIYQKKNNIIIKILDNGIGMTKLKTSQLNDELKNRYGYNDKHLGLRNVNQRIKIMFGEQYGIEVKSWLNKGTIVKILLPII